MHYKFQFPPGSSCIFSCMLDLGSQTAIGARAILKHCNMAAAVGRVISQHFNLSTTEATLASSARTNLHAQRINISFMLYARHAFGTKPYLVCYACEDHKRCTLRRLPGHRSFGSGGFPRPTSEFRG